MITVDTEDGFVRLTLESPEGDSQSHLMSVPRTQALIADLDAAIRWLSGRTYASDEEALRAAAAYAAKAEPCPFCGDRFHNLAAHIRPKHPVEYEAWYAQRHGASAVPDLAPGGDDSVGVASAAPQGPPNNHSATEGSA